MGGIVCCTVKSEHVGVWLRTQVQGVDVFISWEQFSSPWAVIVRVIINGSVQCVHLGVKACVSATTQTDRPYFNTH